MVLREAFSIKLTSLINELRKIAYFCGNTCVANEASTRAIPLFCSNTGSFLILANNAFCAEIAKTPSGFKLSCFAVLSTCFCMVWAISALVFSSSHKISILFNTANLWLPRGRIYCIQISISDLVTPVSVASKNITAWAFDKILMVSSGSAPKVFRPGVSKIIKPLLSNGCG